MKTTLILLKDLENVKVTEKNKSTAVNSKTTLIKPISNITTRISFYKLLNILFKKIWKQSLLILSALFLFKKGSSTFLLAIRALSMFFTFLSVIFSGGFFISFNLYPYDIVMDWILNIKE